MVLKLNAQWQHSIHNRHHVLFQIDLEEDEFIELKDTYRAGLYIPEHDLEIPIATSFDLTANVVTSLDNRSFALGSSNEFDTLVFPYEFKISFCELLGK